MNSTVDAETLKKNFAPSIGDHTQSFLVPWGTDGSNQDKLRVSTVQDLLQGGGGDQNSTLPKILSGIKLISSWTC
jgi:hypothetical protein